MLSEMGTEREMWMSVFRGKNLENWTQPPLTMTYAYEIDQHFTGVVYTAAL